MAGEVVELAVADSVAQVLKCVSGCLALVSTYTAAVLSPIGWLPSPSFSCAMRLQALGHEEDAIVNPHCQLAEVQQAQRQEAAAEVARQQRADDEQARGQGQG